MDEMIICRCEEIPLKTIRKTVQEGACTIREVKLQTRAGMGICQGRTCRPLVEKLLPSEKEQAAVYQISGYRLPVRPLLLQDFFKE
ncbi:(2Fe-2S)-binding protein [Ammoniphilus resinae]|uniref:NAD(P)H-nitrite reductase large subunit n=1 Tax=Ammoniphilus resinae TaxID=861532 RepID=A0ABS4GN75_9BACL|nr:(2Fe-2S)-binding protein [Ammoniphilus resinae]MBP1931724.1 NAD(P)H-nitrite reductase large subunit [Ammoniphilus resinae]